VAIKDTTSFDTDLILLQPCDTLKGQSLSPLQTAVFAEFHECMNILWKALSKQILWSFNMRTNTNISSQAHLVTQLCLNEITNKHVMITTLHCYYSSLHSNRESKFIEGW